MIQALNHPSGADVGLATPRQQRFLWTVYYLCWAISLLAPGTAGVLLVSRRFGLALDADAAVLLGAALGVALGLTLAHWMRRPRWAHFGPVALGAPVACTGLVMLCVAQASPGALLWEMWPFLYFMIAVNGLALCCAGAAGLRLNAAPR